MVEIILDVETGLQERRSCVVLRGTEQCLGVEKYRVVVQPKEGARVSSRLPIATTRRKNLDPSQKRRYVSTPRQFECLSLKCSLATRNSFMQSLPLQIQDTPSTKNIPPFPSMSKKLFEFNQGQQLSEPLLQPSQPAYQTGSCNLE